MEAAKPSSGPVEATKDQGGIPVPTSTAPRYRSRLIRAGTSLPGLSFIRSSLTATAGSDTTPHFQRPLRRGPTTRRSSIQADNVGLEFDLGQGQNEFKDLFRKRSGSVGLKTPGWEPGVSLHAVEDGQDRQCEGAWSTCTEMRVRSATATGCELRRNRYKLHIPNNHNCLEEPEDSRRHPDLDDQQGVFGNNDDQVPVLCLMPTGVAFEMDVDLDDVVLNVKQAVLDMATTDERLPLKGCLDPDAAKYVVTCVTQRGQRQEIFDETLTLRELKPFKNILSFSLRSKSRHQSNFKKSIGTLIGKDLEEFKEMRNCEVNDFRWKMRGFANGVALRRKQRLERSWQERIHYQYPPRLVGNKSGCSTKMWTHTKESYPVLVVDGGAETVVVVDFEDTCDDLLLKVVLGSGPGSGALDITITATSAAGRDPGQYCFKTVGEESYLFGHERRLIDYAFVHEHVIVNEAPRLVLTREDQVELERVGDNVYARLDRDCSSSMSGKLVHVNGPVYGKEGWGGGLQAESGSPSRCRHARSGSSSSSNNVKVAAAIPSSTVGNPFAILIESATLSPDILSNCRWWSSQQSHLSRSISSSNSSNVGSGYSSHLYIQVGLFHGGRQLCPCLTKRLTSSSSSWQEDSGGPCLDLPQAINFAMSVSSLPRMAKLCIGILEKRGRGGSISAGLGGGGSGGGSDLAAVPNNQVLLPLAWININVFDYKGGLKQRDTFRLWKYSHGDLMPTHEAALSPLRHTVSNPDVRGLAPADLIIAFGDEPTIDTYLAANNKSSLGRIDDDQLFSPSSPNVEWSVMSRMDAAALVRVQFHSPEVVDAEDDDPAEDTGLAGSGRADIISKLYSQDLEQIAMRDPLHSTTVQEEDLIWKARGYCCARLPQLLPRIVDCVDYANPDQVRELHRLLRRWPLLPVEEALQLLDYAYPDMKVRRFAVTCLKANASDTDVVLYLLQLAQALKHEAYLFSDLVEFLLERALDNQHIGHYLFWELRSEMNNKRSVAGLLYGLILEAYLVAAPEHTKILAHQAVLLEKCRASAMSIIRMDQGSMKGLEKAKVRFAASLKSQFNGYSPYKNFINPLNPNQKCKAIKPEKCRLMNSKKRPQWLTFENADSSVEAAIEVESSTRMQRENLVPDIVFMYKRGDDLRQDCLTLQLLSVMDRLWKNSGLDMRMRIYRCIATEQNEGLIEVVQNAETMCRIQMRFSGSAASVASAAVFRKGLLLSWLKSNNNPKELLRVQDVFTLSCAGYSVAAYVLGIGDRHNDNIMVRPNGQVFHIDFGHFLGNFKHKFGIRRERVPLILCSEFVDVIRTSDFGRQRNFDTFRNLCERAYLILRRNGSLLISLLAMMISTGLPELSSESDLNVIRSNLNLDSATEEEALALFRKDFDESLRNAWKISLDWWFHMMNQVRSSK